MNDLLVACAEFGSIAVALVPLGYVANYYAPHTRAPGTGWAVGVRRSAAMCGLRIGGYLVGLNVSPT